MTLLILRKRPTYRNSLTGLEDIIISNDIMKPRILKIFDFYFILNCEQFDITSNRFMSLYVFVIIVNALCE